MSSRPPRIAPCCGRRVPAGERCECQQARDRARKAEADRNRASATARGYDAQWRKERNAFLAAHPRCAQCERKATVVDHIKPHKGDPALFWNKDNWQPLCRTHHAQKTARHDGAFGNPIKTGGGRKVSMTDVGPSGGPSRGIFPNPAGKIEVAI